MLRIRTNNKIKVIDVERRSVRCRYFWAGGRASKEMRMGIKVGRRRLTSRPGFSAAGGKLYVADTKQPFDFVVVDLAGHESSYNA